MPNNATAPIGAQPAPQVGRLDPLSLKTISSRPSAMPVRIATTTAGGKERRASSLNRKAVPQKTVRASRVIQSHLLGDLGIFTTYMYEYLNI